MDINYNSHCYNIKKQTYKKGFLDASVDATYIIHLKDNGRIEHIQGQLTKYHPTKLVYIVFNDGFKKCNKKLIEQVSYQDLTDAFLQCFKHADEHGYNNILILEDDFIFSSEIKKNPEHINNVNKFLNKNRNKEFIYYLGCNPIIVRPCTSDFNHYKSYKSCSTHAIIYSKATRSKNLNLELKHWDVIIEDGVSNRYLYCKPICYQTYPDTENKKTWSEKDFALIGYLKNAIIKGLNLDVKPEPGFSILYFLAKALNLLVFLSLIFIIVYIILVVIKYYNIFQIKTYSKRK
jgi:hypothetical protein